MVSKVVPSQKPTPTRIVFHTRLPAVVYIRKRQNGMCISPAGIEITVRPSGMKRNMNTVTPPQRSKKRRSLSTSSHSIVSQRPQRSTIGLSRS